MSRSLSETAIGAGIPLGAGVAATTAVLLESDSLGLSVGYGAGAGVLIGAALAYWGNNASEAENTEIQLLVVGVLAGAGVGFSVGGLAAWSVNEAVSDGVLVGGVTGVVLGLLLAGVVVAQERRRRKEGLGDA